MDTEIPELSDQDIEYILQSSASNPATDCKVKCIGSFVGAPLGHHPSYRWPEETPKIGRIYLAKETNNGEGYIINGVPSYCVKTNQDVGWRKEAFEKL